VTYSNDRMEYFILGVNKLVDAGCCESIEKVKYEIKRSGMVEYLEDQYGEAINFDVLAGDDFYFRQEINKVFKDVFEYIEADDGSKLGIFTNGLSMIVSLGITIIHEIMPLQVLVKRDIKLCEEIILADNKQLAEEEISRMLPAWSGYIPGLSKGLYYLSLNSAPDYISDIEKIKRKLELFKANSCLPLKWDIKTKVEYVSDRNIVYKYCPPERITFFNDQLLKFTQPSKFNDPFEFLPAEEFVSETDKQLLIEELFCENQKNRINNELQIYSELQALMVGTYDSTGVLCLSAVWNNMLMWSNYALDHMGFCIGFDSNHPFFAKGRKIGISEVIYCNERPKFDLNKNWLQELVYIKSKDWSYEKELRICREISKRDVKVGDSYLFKLPVEAVKCIILGVRIQSETKRKILHAVSNWTVKPIIYQAYMHPTEYRIIAFNNYDY